MSPALIPHEFIHYSRASHKAPFMIKSFGISEKDFSSLYQDTEITKSVPFFSWYPNSSLGLNCHMSSTEALAAKEDTQFIFI